MPEVGIENLKEAVHLAISLPIQAVKTIKNKFQIFDLLAFIDEFRQLGDVIKTRKDIGAELKDLSPAERQELHDYIKEEFDIPNDKVELFIENSLAWANSTITLIEEAKNLKK
jgi:hypothetical protein